MPLKPHGWLGLAPLLGALALSGAAHAQLGSRLGGPVGGIVGGVGGEVGAVTHDVAGDVRDTTQAVGDLASARLDSLRALVRANPKALEFDAHGQAVVRGEVMAIDPSADALARARAAGFGVLGESVLDPLGLKVVRLSVPEGTPAREALKRIRKLDPDGQYDLDHIYAQSGAAGPPASGTAGAAGEGRALVGMLDSGVDAGHPALTGVIAAQQGFAPGGVVPGPHGTAVASLIAGRGPKVSGADAAGRLLVADVYGSGPTGGSADAIARALAFMAAHKVGVVNVSLVGPQNLTVQAVVKAMVARGVLIVAPVGNDGPAAPPLYPASYPGVIAVTGVDSRGRPLPEAGHAAHVDFAALGADVLAAQPGGGYARLRGTSFAAPVVAGRLAALEEGEGSSAAGRAVAALIAAAKPAHGDRWLGRGIVSEPVERAAN